MLKDNSFSFLPLHKAERRGPEPRLRAKVRTRPLGTLRARRRASALMHGRKSAALTCIKLHFRTAPIIVSARPSWSWSPPYLLSC